MTDLTGHELWPDDIDLVRTCAATFDRLHGYRQVTDAHLLAVATRHGGRLVTFDAAVADLAEDRARVTVLRL